MNDLMREIVSVLVRSGMAREEEIQGCTPAEVEEVEARFRVRLPGTYRAFLLTMGRGAGFYFIGTDIFYPAVLELRRLAANLLQLSGTPFAIPDDAFFFLGHQNYHFMFFRTANGDEDPLVYSYMEGEDTAIADGRRFSQFLEDQLEESNRIYQTLSPELQQLGRGGVHGVRLGSPGPKERPPDG